MCRPTCSRARLLSFSSRIPSPASRLRTRNPPHDRIQRWGRAIGEAGRRPIDLDELLRLQRIVIGDARFVRLGLRDEGGFVGQHDRDTRMPLPDHISARPEDFAIPDRRSGGVRPLGRAATSIPSWPRRRSPLASSTSTHSRTETAVCTAT